MTRCVRFTFLDKDNKRHHLHYKIFESDLASRWLSILDQNTQRKDNYIHSFFMNYTPDRFPEILNELNQHVININEKYDRRLPLFPDTSKIDQDILNYLHEEYEIYGDRVQELISSKEKSIDAHNSFLRLNELIHICEILLDQKEDDMSHMSILFDYYPQEIHENIKEKDKLYLTNDFQWGDLYLGYNTLGKDWLEVSNHNDIDVILRDQVRPQNRFAAESWIYFSGDSKDSYNTIKFEKWYDSLSDNVKSLVPISDLNKLCLGRFRIGSIRLDDAFLKFHPNKYDWLSPNHPIKNKWNREVFSTFRKLIGVLVYE